VTIGAHRKVVTVLFCDVVGSTALGESVDLETLQAVLARYFERMKGIVESHGGTVDKFIGDAVMAVFGVPVAHEDDALRACRAATEMRDALPELGVAGRIGVNTGEALTGTEERLATGDVLNVAARLEQAAAPGEVLIGSETLALVEPAVEVGEKQLLELKGKREPVAAYALGAVRGAERAHGSPFVGREQELEQLVQAWDRALAGSCCELVTVVGDAGVGKSRLVVEALDQIDARVVRGRCLSYGEGITYWPVVEVVKQLDALPNDEQAANAIRSLLRESDAAAGTDEIAWAVRKLLEEQAPLVVCFDDLQWGEKTFLDLVESTAALSTGVTVLLVCMARPELLERRPRWPSTLQLNPLQGRDAELLVGDLPADVRERIIRTSGGNPLFLIEMVALAGDRAEVEIPPTLRSLLAARLDQLEAPERRLLELGAIEGELFHHGAIQALATEETELTPWLAALVRHDLIRPDQPQVPGEDAYRFRHILIRDAAYDALPKTRRTGLHERFAAWLEEHGTGLVELDELVGYHLEQAVRYQQELGRPVDEPLAAEGGRRLTAAGRRAFARQDHVAAAGLLERAAALLPAGKLDAILEFELLDALLGVDGERALRRAETLAERAAAVGDPLGELCWRLEEGTVRSWLEREGAADRLAALVEQALALFEAAGDDLALCVAYRALGRVADTRGQVDTMAEAGEQAAFHAQRAGLSERQVGRYGSIRRARGAIPASELLAWLDEQDEHDLRVRTGRAWVLAMLGRIEEARALLAALRADDAERGGVLLLGAIGEVGFEVELLAGDPAAAAAVGEELCGRLEGAGSRDLEAFAGRLAQAYYQLGSLDDADAWAARAAELGTSDDAYTQMLWRQARAKVLARRDDHPEARRLAYEAVAISDGTEMLDAQADAYADLAEVLSLAARRREAAQALEQALGRYERKQNLVMAERTRTRLEELAYP
jgi:class 3 adenylate cyclase